MLPRGSVEQGVGAWLVEMSELLRPLCLRPNVAAEVNRVGHNRAQRALTLEFAERGFVVVNLKIEDFVSLAARIFDQCALLYEI
jgi:hypothetical protein